MLDKFCKNCKHWTPPEPGQRNPEYGYCSIFDSDSGDPEQPNQLAFASDSDAIYARLRTKPEFGCNQFELNQTDENKKVAKAEAKVFWDKADALWPKVLEAGGWVNKNPGREDLVLHFRELNQQYKNYCDKAKELDPNYKDGE